MLTCQSGGSCASGKNQITTDIITGPILNTSTNTKLLQKMDIVVPGSLTQIKQKSYSFLMSKQFLNQNHLNRNNLNMNNKFMNASMSTSVSAVPFQPADTPGISSSTSSASSSSSSTTSSSSSYYTSTLPTIDHHTTFNSSILRNRNFIKIKSSLS